MPKQKISDRDIQYLLASAVSVESQLKVQISRPFGGVMQPLPIPDMEKNGVNHAPIDQPDDSNPFTRDDFLAALGKML